MVLSNGIFAFAVVKLKTKPKLHISDRFLVSLALLTLSDGEKVDPLLIILIRIRGCDWVNRIWCIRIIPTDYWLLDRIWFCFTQEKRFEWTILLRNDRGLIFLLLVVPN